MTALPSLWKEQIAANRLAHAYLILSVDTEKSIKATQELIKSLSVTSADVIWVKPENKNILIGQIRSVIRQINLKPHSSPWKVVVFVQAHTMTIEAANALLKTLEDPPAHSVIILLSLSPDYLPSTIVSRCQTIRLESEPKEDQRPELGIILLKELAEQFRIANELSKDDQLTEKIDGWIKELRNDLIKGRATQKQIRILLGFKKRINYNLNRRLQIEDLLIKLGEHHG
jgi:hypothetical protein